MGTKGAPRPRPTPKQRSGSVDRSDTERLDWIEKNCWKLNVNGEQDDKDEEIVILFPLRELIDKAMEN